MTEREIIELLLHTKVDWQETPVSGYHFVCHFQDEVILLRLNDFPEEPLLTVMVNGVEQELETTPANWSLPFHRQNRE